MRSFFVFLTTPVNDFHRCNVQVPCFSEQTSEQLLHDLRKAAEKRFKELHVKIPNGSRMRFLPDHRNELDRAGYEREELERVTRPPARGASESYCVASEYTPGETVTH